MTQLSPKAESLRQEIKQMISDAVPKKDPTEISQQTVFIVDAIGNKSYEGELLKKKVTLLMEEMGYEQVCGSEAPHNTSSLNVILGMGVGSSIFPSVRNSHYQQILTDVYHRAIEFASQPRW